MEHPLMPRPRNTIPSYRLHRASGQALVTIRDRAIYLGTHDSPESRRKYAAVVAEYLRTGEAPPLKRQRALPISPAVLTVADMILAFRTWAMDYYGPDAAEVENYRLAIRPLLKLYGDTPAADFGPRALKQVREEMIERGWSRTHINNCIRRVRRAFKWGVGEEMIPGNAHEALRAVEGLRYGRSKAKESKPRRDVPDLTVRQTLPFLSPTVAAMVQVQLLTGMRPSELVSMTTGQMDVRGEVWKYRPQKHKTQHHGHSRIIVIGPKAQAIMAPYMTVDPNAPIFSPRIAEQEKTGHRRANRKTPAKQGNGPGTNRKPTPQKQPGRFYDAITYARAISYACDQAFPSAAAMELVQRVETVRTEQKQAGQKPRRADIRKGILQDDPDLKTRLREERKANRWTPYQLRHRLATDLYEAEGVERTQAVLGHRPGSSVTDVYLHLTGKVAEDVARRVG